MTSANRQIARATAIVMLAFVASRVLGLVRQAVMGGLFGLELDAYFAAFRIPDFLFNIVAGGALGSAFIPTFAGYLARDDRAGAWRLASAVASWVVLVLGVAAGVAALVAPQLVETWLSSGSVDPAMRTLTVELLRIMLIATVIFGLSGLIMGVLNALHHFTTPAFAPALYNLGIIAGAVGLTPWLGIHGLAWGVVLGACLHFAVQLPALAHFGARFTPTLAWRDTGVRDVARLMGPRVVGLAVVQINFLIETFLAAPLGPGSLSALTYAWQAMLLPQAVFAQAAANAAFPTFAAQAARGDLPALRATLGATLRGVLFLAIPATVGVVLLREPFIALLLERGAFTPADTARVAWALLCYALGLAAHSVLEIITRVFYALQDTRTPVLAGIASMVLNVVFSLSFIALLQAGRIDAIGGLGLANALATWLETLVLLVVLARRLGGLADAPLAGAIVRMSVAALVMGGAVWGWLLVAPQGAGLLNRLSAGGGGALVGSVVYGACALALGVAEARGALDMVRRRVGR